MPYKNPRDRRQSDRRYKLKKRYGVSTVEYDAMMANQEGRCGACQEHRFLVVDHDHATGAIRGLLCEPCNLLAGSLEHPRRPAIEHYLANPPGNPLEALDESK